MQGLAGFHHTDTALDLAKADHRQRIERARSHRLAASFQSTPTPEKTRSVGPARSVGHLRRVAHTLVAIVAVFMVVGVILAVAGPAQANPCVDDRAFAEANGCSDLYDRDDTVAVTEEVSPSERVWLLHIDPADAAAFRAAESVRIVSGPLRPI